MKTIKGVDEKIQWFTEIEEKDKEALPTYRKLFLTATATSFSKNAEDSIDIYQLGLKLKVAGDDLQLEDAEFKILKRVCEEFSAGTRRDGWISHIQALVLMKLKESEKEK